MARRRFGPLVVSVVVATAVLLLRLAQVQLTVQHEVWADQASTLVRVGRVVPYRRGEISDRLDRPLVRDVEAYRVVFVQREFRREHPLGQVAHALAAIELRCVPLAEALERLDELALALVELTPSELEAFGRGEALQHGPLRAPALDEHQRASEQRWSRRGDVVFYVVRLLGLEGREAGWLAKLVREKAALGEESYLELAARARRAAAPGRRPDLGTATADELRDELMARLGACRADLEELAGLLAVAEPQGPRRPGQGALARLLERLEGWRAQVEDGAASDLFEEACGFSPGRVEPATVLAHVDLAPIRALMRWDPERTAAWLARERDRWRVHEGLEGELEETYALQQLLIEAELALDSVDRVELVLDSWAQPFLAPPEAARQASLLELLAGAADGPPRQLAVFSQLDELFALRVPLDARPSHTLLFAFQDRAWVEAGAADPCEVLARTELWSPGLGADELARLAPAVEERAQAWQAWREDYEAQRVRDMLEQLEAWTRERWGAWEEVFQERLAQELERLDRQVEGPLKLADGRLDRASERARFVLRDHGGRSAVVAEAPDHALVHLLSRRPWSFAGFEVERAHERVRTRAVPPGGGEPRAPLLDALLGAVRTPRLSDLYVQREERREFAELRAMGRRDEAQQRRFLELIERTRRPDEIRGSDGLEGYLDDLLRGTNGYVEELGLQQELERVDRTTDVAPVDGRPVGLTLDLDLQLAALEVLAHPRPDPRGEELDWGWLERPTGALVLLDVAGDVLAMASYPDAPRGDGRGLADRPLERTLRLYESQPPGSVMKPFVAAWALDRLGLDRHTTRECSAAAHPATGRPGYKTVHCSSVAGHGAQVDLQDALKRSCNTYFAWVGDQFYDPASWLEMYAGFGFGQPTGIRALGARAGGLREDGSGGTQPGERSLRRPRDLMLACNGLAIPQTTVLQVARAYAGLATGQLPQLRLLRTLDDRPVPSGSQQLPLKPESLQRVRDALVMCANETGWPRGSASPALAEGQLGLGFEVAAKTGSADLRRTGADSDAPVLKHTWLACWFPAEQPRYVLVVFCRGTYATSSHSSIWVAQQFLQHPTLAEWLRRQGERP